ncbi:unnamed protein product, partial [Didymodactylos carnosus]
TEVNVAEAFEHYRSLLNCYFGIANLSSLGPISITQSIAVADYSVLIDSGRAEYNFSGMFGGNAYAEITFFTSTAVKAGKNVMIGLDDRQNETETILFQHKFGAIPLDTRQLVLIIYFEKFPERKDIILLFLIM